MRFKSPQKTRGAKKLGAGIDVHGELLPGASKNVPPAKASPPVKSTPPAKASPPAKANGAANPLVGASASAGGSDVIAVPTGERPRHRPQCGTARSPAVNTGVSRQMRITPRTGKTGVTTVVLTASDGVATTIKTFTLTVTP
ncbi:MAG TPA: hypothetical protein VIK61_03715 [Acidimicrobiia bacterium]